MAARLVHRLLGAVLVLLVAGCGSEPEPVYVPPEYTYLTPLRLNVGAITIQDDFVPAPDDVGMLSPAPPLDALHRMAHDRLVAAGSTGRAMLRIRDASIRRLGDGVSGNLVVRLDIVGANGAVAGYAEARVSRATAVSDEPIRQVLYRLTTQMMRDMNVELEYQLRRTLHEWMPDAGSPAGAVPAPVQQQPLPVPGKEPQHPPPGL